jgi:hypothetical protein
VLPALVIEPCTRELPEEYSEGSCATSGTRTKGTQVFNSDVLMGFQHLLRSVSDLSGNA